MFNWLYKCCLSDKVNHLDVYIHIEFFYSYEPIFLLKNRFVEPKPPNQKCVARENNEA